MALLPLIMTHASLHMSCCSRLFLARRPDLREVRCCGRGTFDVAADVEQLVRLTMFLSFTGYLLPWDQLAIWAVTVGSNMARAHPFIGHEGPGASLLAIGDINLVHIGSDVRFALIGGRFVGEATLLRFYVIHCIAVPFIMMIFMAVHFWRIRKDGGISGPL